MVQTNETGFVLSPRLHDSHIFGLEIVGRDLRIKVISVDGQALLLTLVNVEDLEINRFWMGNLILEVRILTGNRVEPDWIATIRESEIPLAPSEKTFVDRFESVKAGRLKYLTISSSYGMTLQALCQDVTVLET